MKLYLFLTIIIGFVLSGLVYSQELKPRDGFRVTIFNIPDKISGDYYVQIDSTLQLPFIGNLSISKKTYSMLINEIIQKYQTIYRNPEISVQPLFRINVLGEVKSPGEYYFTGVEKLTDIIAKAGGETLDADLGNVILTRDDKEISVDAKAILEGKNSSSDINLNPGDRVYITKKWFGGAQNTNIILYGAAVLVALASLIFK